MRKYIIYCTDEQTRKALELGAPIFTFSESVADGYRTSTYDKYCSIPPIREEDYEDDVYADNPTAEQMIGWIREENCLSLFVEPEPYNGGRIWIGKIYNINSPSNFHSYNCLFWKEFNSYNDAIMATIDYALNFISSIKSTLERI